MNQRHRYRLDIDSTSGNAAPGAAGSTFDRWEVHHGEAVIATKVIAPPTTDSDGIPYTSPTSLKLVHTPGP